MSNWQGQDCYSGLFHFRGSFLDPQLSESHSYEVVGQARLSQSSVEKRTLACLCLGVESQAISVGIWKQACVSPSPLLPCSPSPQVANVRFLWAVQELCGPRRFSRKWSSNPFFPALSVPSSGGPEERAWQGG